jgi:molybdopterin-binding protein
MNKLTNTPILRMDRISKRFPSFSLIDISFSLQKGDYFNLLGVSGSGKSMVLETIAGLVIPDSGRIELNGADITHEKIQKRRIGLVFQDHAVFPHFNVSDNISYPLRSHSIKHEDKNRIVEEVATTLGISGLLHRRPASLSGGELQRVALARALVQKPEILLLDEPLASLDTKLKSELRSLLRQLNRKGQTIIHVTHDYEEALSLGNRIAVLHQGVILQTGTPAEVFSHPKSEFVAHFTGSKNFFNVTFHDEADIASVNDKIKIRIAAKREHENGYILIRAEEIFLSNATVNTSATNNFEGAIREIVPTITGVEVLIDIGIPLYSVITSESMDHLGLVEGRKCFVHFKASAVRFISAL